MANHEAFESDDTPQASTRPLPIVNRSTGDPQPPRNPAHEPRHLVEAVGFRTAETVPIDIVGNGLKRARHARRPSDTGGVRRIIDGGRGRQ